MRKSLSKPGPLESFDERDSVFTRARLKPGTARHDEHYARHPEHFSADLRSRKLPHLASPGGQRYEVEAALLIQSQFAASDLIADAVEGSEFASAVGLPEGLAHGAGGPGAAHVLEDSSPAGLTLFAKNAAMFLGADDVGVAPLDPAHVYSHRGRPKEKHGHVPDLKHSHAIVLVFAMRHAYVASGPEMISTAEVARVYQQAAAACFALADSLRRLGHSARAHVDSNYLVVCPPLAVDAGLGELGRHGILIHPRLGSGVRLGVVTVDAPLVVDQPGSWGIAEFCKTCKKCAKLCPAGAIPDGEPSLLRGAEKWPLSPERCYHYWRTQGTDCGICMRVCPFTKHDTALHRIVRRTIAATPIFNRAFLWMDDLFYGRHREPKKVTGLGG
ncbi:reductive dehalogenase [bacterium]|nr:reductive dehalogenase [bacterium]